MYKDNLVRQEQAKDLRRRAEAHHVDKTLMNEANIQPGENIFKQMLSWVTGHLATSLIKPAKTGSQNLQSHQPANTR